MQHCAKIQNCATTEHLFESSPTPAPSRRRSKSQISSNKRKLNTSKQSGPCSLIYVPCTGIAAKACLELPFQAVFPARLCSTALLTMISSLATRKCAEHIAIQHRSTGTQIPWWYSYSYLSQATHKATQKTYWYDRMAIHTKVHGFDASRRGKNMLNSSRD